MAGWVVPLGISDRQNDRFEVNRDTGPWHVDDFNRGDTGLTRVDSWVFRPERLTRPFRRSGSTLRP